MKLCRTYLYYGKSYRFVLVCKILLIYKLMRLEFPISDRLYFHFLQRKTMNHGNVSVPEDMWEVTLQRQRTNTPPRGAFCKRNTFEIRSVCGLYAVLMRDDIGVYTKKNKIPLKQDETEY